MVAPNFSMKVLFKTPTSWAEVASRADDTTLKDGKEVKGETGVLVAVIGSYGVTVTLFVRPTVAAQVGSLLTLVGIQLQKPLKVT